MRTVLKALLLRRKFTLLAVVAALTLGTASAALAGSGVNGVFNLGVNNTVNAITKLVGTVAGPSLQITNNSTDSAATALNLQVAAGKPPMKVNRNTKVTNLNADLLDGKDQNAFLPKTAFASGYGADPSATLQFLAPPAVVTVSAGQAVHVTSNKAFGSFSAGGASGLGLYICHRPQGSTAAPTTFGGGILGNSVAQNTRVTMGLSAVITGLPAGNHEVGMCGFDDGNGNWNNNEWGYTSALVVTPQSGGAALAAAASQIQER